MSKRGQRLCGSSALIASLCLGADVGRAEMSEIPDTPAWRANVGWVTGAGLAIVMPAKGNTGVGLELMGRHGFPLGPVVLAPGALMAAHFVDDRVIGVLMPTGRVTLPLGPFAPFAQAGAGAGGITDPGDGGLAWLAGGGLMVHFGESFALGADVHYQGITGTGYRALSIGPTLVIGG